MTLDEAIQHALEIAADSSCKYVEEYSQIAAWLTELKRLRSSEKLSRKLLQAMFDIRAEKNACRKEDNGPAFMMALMREYDIFKQAEAFLQQEGK